MLADPGDEIRRIQKEYEDKAKTTDVCCVEENLPEDCVVGTLWLNPETNDFYVCNGKIHGKSVWTKVEQKAWI